MPSAAQSDKEGFMETEERFEGLSATELTALRKKKKSAIDILIAMTVMLMVGGAWAVRRNSWLYIIIVILLTPLLVLLIFQRKLRSVQSLTSDLRDGKKKIVVDRVESQRQDINATGNNSDLVDDALGASGPSMSYAYWLKVRGKEFKVSELLYYQCKPGQLVEIHLAPHSEHVFTLRVLKDSAAAASPQTTPA
jgi:hypothetical protein